MTGFGSNQSEGVEQSVATSPGVSYVLSFYVGNLAPTSTSLFGATSTINLFINGLAAGTFTNLAPSQNLTWQLFSVLYTATASTTTFRFLSADGANDNLNGLDNVSLSEVPLPAGALLLVTGLPMLAARRRGSAQA